MSKRIKNNLIFLLSVIMIVSVFVISGCKPSVEYVNKFDVNSAYMVNSVNHRGYYTAPENTLAAYRESARNGFTMVECDVAFTKDGHAVLLHDDSVERTSNGTGNIEELTFEQVRALDFGSWKDKKYVGEKIPSFEEFISLCRNLSLHPYIEVKWKITSEQTSALVETVIKYGMIDKVTWISSSKKCLRTVLEADSGARIGLIVSCVSEENIEDLISVGAGKNKAFLDCDQGFVDSRAIDMCIKSRIPLEVWTVDDEQKILELDPYISGVTSNRLVAGEVLYNYALEHAQK